MKCILVPIDFSNVSENAFNYAIELARPNNAKLVLVHVSNPDEKVSPKEISEIETRLLNLCLTIAHRAGAESTFVYKSGDLIEKILETAEEKKAGLIVMGTGRYKDFTKMLFGTNTLNTLAKIQLPILIVPEKNAFKNLRTVTYATNYKASDIMTLKYLADLLRPFRPQINLLHISDETVSPEEEMQSMENFMAKVNSAVDYNNLSFQVICAGNVAARLGEYISSGSADMLVMSTHLDKKWHTIFESSITQEIANSTPVPLLAFHHNKNTSVKLFS